MRRAVLGHPFHGALYWLLSAEHWRGVSPKSVPDTQHGYYQTLYGSNPGAVIDELVSLYLLYDEVLVVGADCYLPDRNTYASGDAYHNPDLGLLSDWGWRGDHGELVEMTRVALADRAVGFHLRMLPDFARDLVVETAIIQLRIRDQYSADLLASRAHLRLCQSIAGALKLTAPSRADRRDDFATGLATVFDIAALQFAVKGIDQFVALRSAEPLRDYAAGFAAAIDRLPQGVDVETELYRLMAKAKNTTDIADSISGGMGVAASASGPVSLIPIVGTVAGGFGMAADAGSRIAAGVAARNRWWNLAPEISRVLTMQEIEARANRVGDGRQPEA